MDNAYVELHAGGKITKNVGVTLNLNANWAGYNTTGASTGVAVEDAIVSFDFMDEFHLWAGHLLVPVDRSNASGPFFMIPWNYPGFFTGPFVGAPAEGPSGRNNGAVIWGDISGGKFSYFAGVFDNGNVATEPVLVRQAAARAAGSRARVLGQRQLLRRQGHAVVRRRWTGRRRTGRSRATRPTPTSTSMGCWKRSSAAAAS